MNRGFDRNAIGAKRLSRNVSPRFDPVRPGPSIRLLISRLKVRFLRGAPTSAHLSPETADHLLKVPQPYWLVVSARHQPTVIWAEGGGSHPVRVMGRPCPGDLAVAGIE